MADETGNYAINHISNSAGYNITGQNALNWIRSFQGCFNTFIAGLFRS